MNPLMDALGAVGNVLSWPGGMVRGLLAGRPGEQVSGQELLGLDDSIGGTLGGIGVDMLTDPLTYAGGALAKLLFRGGKAGKAATVAKAVDPQELMATNVIRKPAAMSAAEANAAMTPTRVVQPQGSAINLHKMMTEDPDLAAALAGWKSKMAQAPYGGYGDPALFNSSSPITRALMQGQ